MYYVYCIQKIKSRTLYYGYTQDLQRRTREHNKKEKCILVYYEAYRSENDARKRERKLKQYGQSRAHLKNRIQDSLLKNK